jgi:hypothetical protein
MGLWHVKKEDSILVRRLGQKHHHNTKGKIIKAQNTKASKVPSMSLNLRLKP